jgi:site-specific DNA recombinase
MRWVFQEIAKGKLNTEQIWKLANKKGLNATKNSFWIALRNPNLLWKNIHSKI